MWTYDRFFLFVWELVRGIINLHSELLWGNYQTEPKNHHQIGSVLISTRSPRHLPVGDPGDLWVTVLVLTLAPLSWDLGPQTLHSTPLLYWWKPFSQTSLPNCPSWPGSMSPPIVCTFWFTEAYGTFSKSLSLPW